MKSIEHQVISAENKSVMTLPAKNDLKDAINLGFAFVESEDHMVRYIVTNPKMMQKILSNIKDAVLDPNQEILGRLATAELILSRRVKGKRILFSDSDSTTVLVLDTDGMEQDADL